MGSLGAAAAHSGARSSAGLPEKENSLTTGRVLHRRGKPKRCRFVAYFLTALHNWGNKKAILAEAMEAAFSEDARERAGLTPGAAVKTARWLPIGMGFAIEEVGSACAETSSAIETTSGELIGDSVDDIDGGEGDRAADGKTAEDAEDAAREDEEVKIPAFLTEAA